MKNNHLNGLARSLHDFFCDYLPGLRGMSSHTIQSYRDSLVLLLRFLASEKNHDPATLDLDNISPEDVIAFLNHLEKERRNTVSTRNVRLAAIHAFFRYVTAQFPDRMEQTQRILGIPLKRTRSHLIDYLEYDEICAVLSSVDRSVPQGRRDYVLLVVMFNTGARVQEIVDLRARDFQLIRPFQVLLYGKGRKVRICPLWPQTAQIIREFFTERGLDLSSNALVFLNQRGEPLTRFGVRYILTKQIECAKKITPTLAGKKLHPHSMRHSTAIHLLKSGVDLYTISHWLGHASINTTNKYATIDLEMKRKALAQAEPPKGYPQEVHSAWRSDATILEWLESL